MRGVIRSAVVRPRRFILTGMGTEPNEDDRVATLHRVTRLAARTLNVPTVLVSLVDTTRQWFKSRFGCELQESPGDISFCTHTVSRRLEGANEVNRRTRHLQLANDALPRHVKRLIESERAAQRLRMIANTLPVMFSYWDRHLHCEYVNDAYRKWFGIPPEQAIGMPMSEFLGEQYPAAEPYVKRALQGVAQRYERRDLRRPVDGVPAVLGIQYFPDIDLAGEVRGFIALVRELSRE